MIALLDARTNVTLGDCCNQAITLIDSAWGLGGLSLMGIYRQLLAVRELLFPTACPVGGCAFASPRLLDFSALNVI